LPSSRLNTAIMSLRGRFVIDRIKSAVGHRFKLPVPPYDTEGYWDRVYKSFTPDNHFEWGDLTVSDDLWQYQYDAHEYESFTEKYGYRGHSEPKGQKGEGEGEGERKAPTVRQGTLPEALNMQQATSSTSEKTRARKVVLLGCGNSRMGEELILHGLVGAGDSLVQIDVSQKVVYLMQERWKQQKDFYLNKSEAQSQKKVQQDNEDGEVDPRADEGASILQLPPLDVQIIQDDARHLTSLASNSVDAVIDKGLLDALHCCDADEHMHDIMNSVNRILRPPQLPSTSLSSSEASSSPQGGGVFMSYSYSRPEFFFDRTFLSPALLKEKDSLSPTRRKLIAQSLWRNVEIRTLPSILMYRYEKQAASEAQSQKGPRLKRDGRPPRNPSGRRFPGQTATKRVKRR
jgi:hypothetical protein